MDLNQLTKMYDFAGIVVPVDGGFSVNSGV